MRTTQSEFLPLPVGCYIEFENLHRIPITSNDTGERGQRDSCPIFLDCPLSFVLERTLGATGAAFNKSQNASKCGFLKNYNSNNCAHILLIYCSKSIGVEKFQDS